MKDSGSRKSRHIAASAGARTASVDVRAQAVQRLKQEYRFSQKPSALVHGFLRAAVTSTGSAWGEVRLKEPLLNVDGEGGEGLVFAGDDGHGPAPPHAHADCRLCLSFYSGREHSPVIAGDLRADAHCAGLHLPSGSSMAIPIRYQNRALGVMHLVSERAGHYSRESAAAGEIVAAEIAHHVKRYEVNQHLKRKFCRDLMLVGMSEPLRRVDRFVEKAAMVDLPVLITGEFGVEKEYLAYAIHATGRRREGPFKEVNCAGLSADTSKQDLFDLFRQSDHGTVFFDGIDELDYRLQLQLLEVFNSGVGEWASTMRQSKPFDARVVASAGPLLRETAREEKFSRQLLAGLDFLSISLAPLRERQEDVRPLLEFFLWKYAVGQTLEVSDEVVAVFQKYGWPANVGQFERVVARLATMSDGATTLTLEDVCVNAPETEEALQEACAAKLGCQPRFADNNGAGQAGDGYRGAQGVMPMVSRLIKQEPADLKDLHPCLRKALAYLAYNYSKEVPLSVLAQHACISSSHLCHLFRKELNTNFKAVLSAFRIEKAKQLLVERPSLTTTEVSSEVGFSDPRHYQRLFKQLVGCTSREYKLRDLRQRKSPPPQATP